MVDYVKYTLDNGLRVILHKDNTTPMVTINVLYDVGSKDEDPDKTGFAHLFEHLMFGGTPEIPDYDAIAQEAGASNNAFTSTDITNYYISLPAVNMETGLMLESDRMQGLLFSAESLEVQRKVVIEEFKQRYLNKPYGDIWLELAPLAYTHHPYLWPTIGKNIKHIEEATLEDVKAFFKKHYSPSNAILSIAGNIDIEQTKKDIEKWFGPIPSGNKYDRELKQEPLQSEKRTLTLKRDVPQSAINKVFHMPARMEEGYLSGDLISDLLGRGFSSWFYKNLVKEKKLFTEVHASVAGSMEPGLFSISGMISPGVSFEEAERGIDELLEDLKEGKIDQSLVDKLLNKIESTTVFNEINHSNKAFNLAYYELLGDIELINDEIEKYRLLKIKEIKEFSNAYLMDENSSVLYYESNPTEK
jgi:predicted Zn-dependent peptidase